MRSTTHTDTATWPWVNFSPNEMSCRHCGESYQWPEFMECLQHARLQVGKPFHILSAHRCALHNAHVGGAPLSQHRRLAVDISGQGHDKSLLLDACREAGFTGFGFFHTFLHIDLGRPRQWWSSDITRQLWQTS